MADDKKPLNKQDHDYVFHFRRYRDVYKAGERVGIPKQKAMRFHNRIDIQEEIERQDNIVLSERATVQVKAEALTNDLLDVELLKLIMLDTDKNPEAKRRSIELGYILTGRIESGNTRSLEAKEGPDAKPNFYQAMMPGGVNVTVTPILPEAAPQPIIPTPAPKKQPEPLPQVSRVTKVKIL